MRSAVTSPQRGALQQQCHRRLHAEVPRERCCGSAPPSGNPFPSRSTAGSCPPLRVGVAHDRRDPCAQPVGHDPLGLDGIHVAQRVGAGPVAVVASLRPTPRPLARIAESADLRECGQRAIGAAVRRRYPVRSPASTDSRASMPSAGVIGSRTLQVSERATPTSDHWPQLIAVAGRPDARSPRDQGVEPRTRARVRRLPGRAQQGATEENPTHQSSSRPAVASCSRNAPVALGAHTRSRLSLLRATTSCRRSPPRRARLRAADARSPRRPSPVARPLPEGDIARHDGDFGPASSSARIFRCSSEGSLRPLSTTRPAPLSTSQRATTMPKPAETAGDDVGGTVANHRLALPGTEFGAQEPFDVPAPGPPGDHIIGIGRAKLGCQQR